MLKDWKIASAVIWVSGAATWLLPLVDMGHRYTGIGLLCWFAWLVSVAALLFMHRMRWLLLWTSMPIILLASYNAVLITLMAAPYVLDRILGKSTL
jgi:hypothetical protein